MPLSVGKITLLVLDVFRLLRLELGMQYQGPECSLELQTRFFSVQRGGAIRCSED
jgi:hypothetical protein